MSTITDLIKAEYAKGGEQLYKGDTDQPRDEKGQWTPGEGGAGGGGEHKTSGKVTTAAVEVADTKSLQAKEASHRAGLNGSRKNHEAAAATHGAAEVAQRSVGNKPKAEEHQRAAHFHYSNSIK